MIRRARDTTKQCRAANSACFKTCSVARCPKQVQLHKGKWEFCTAHYKCNHAPVRAPIAKNVKKILPSCLALDEHGVVCTKHRQNHAGFTFMCRVHWKRADAHLPEKVIVISIDDRRLQQCKTELAKYATTVLRKVSHTPLVISRNGKDMLADGSLEGAMKQWDANWVYDPWKQDSMTPGTIGCSLAHLDALRLVSMGTEVVAVVEDDIVVRASSSAPVEDMKTVMMAATTPEGWGVLRIGQHPPRVCPPTDQLQCRKLTRATKLIWGTLRYGTHFSIITPMAARKILLALSRNTALYNVPVDVWMSDCALSAAANIKSLSPCLVKYRMGQPSTTAS
jgi:GR25 family glycosyltransferase involved in LPS biosynthesis